MPSARSLPFSPSMLKRNEGDADFFLRLDIVSPVGTKRFTSRAVDVPVNLDGSTQTWSGGFEILAGPISQTETDPMSVSWIKLANIDFTFTNWALSPGLRRTPFQLWRGFFDDVAGAFAGGYKSYIGEVDDQSHSDISILTVTPFSTQWGREGPFMTVGQLDPMFERLMPARDRPINLGGGVVINSTGPRFPLPPWPVVGGDPSRFPN